MTSETVTAMLMRFKLIRVQIGTHPESCSGWCAPDPVLEPAGNNINHAGQYGDH